MSLSRWSLEGVSVRTRCTSLSELGDGRQQPAPPQGGVCAADAGRVGTLSESRQRGRVGWTYVSLAAGGSARREGRRGSGFGGVIACVSPSRPREVRNSCLSVEVHSALLHARLALSTTSSLNSRLRRGCVARTRSAYEPSRFNRDLQYGWMEWGFH